MTISPVYLAGSIIFLIGSISYTIDALLKKEAFKEGLGYTIGSILFVIGCGFFIADACGIAEHVAPSLNHQGT